MQDDIRQWMLGKIAEAKRSHDWSQLPPDFERDAVRQVFGKIKPHFDKRDIAMRVKASQAVDFDDLEMVIQGKKKNPMNLKKSYETFHGHAPRTKRSWNYHAPKGFVILGKAIAIEYETDKLNGGGDGKKAIYRHEFETPCLLLMDERQKQQLYIVGKRLIVTDRGVEN